MINLTVRQFALLRMFKPDTYGIAIDWKEARELETLGVIEWVPPKFGSTLWMITEKGRQALREWDNNPARLVERKDSDNGRPSR